MLNKLFIYYLHILMHEIIPEQIFQNFYIISYIILREH